MTDQCLQNVNDRKILLQESLDESITKYLILSVKLKNLKASGSEDSDAIQDIESDMETTVGYITHIIEQQ